MESPASPKVAVVTADAALVPVDAAEQVAVVADAAVEAPVDAAVAIAPERPLEKKRSRRDPIDVSGAYSAGRFSEVVSACGSPPQFARFATMCVVSACKVHDAPRAQRWLARVPAAQQANAVNACGNANVALVFHRPEPIEPHRDPPPHDAGVTAPADARVDCSDPLACQH
jgi:hypothetical protein